MEEFFEMRHFTQKERNKANQTNNINNNQKKKKNNNTDLKTI